MARSFGLRYHPPDELQFHLGSSLRQRPALEFLESLHEFRFRGWGIWRTGPPKILRGPGFFDIGSGLSKNLAFSENRLIRLSWEVFNVTNSVRFDAANAVDNEDLVDITGFGKFQRTLTTPRVMQFSLRFAF